MSNIFSNEFFKLNEVNELITDFPLLLETIGVLRFDNGSYYTLAWERFKNNIKTYKDDILPKGIEVLKNYYICYNIKNIIPNIENLYIYYRQAPKIETTGFSYVTNDIPENVHKFILNGNKVKSVSILLNVNINDVQNYLESVFFS